MTSISPHTIGSILQVLPAALVFSSPLLLTEKASAMIQSSLLEGETKPLMHCHIKLAVILTKIPDLGWSHFGIND